MKKWIVLLTALLAIGMIFWSCSEDSTTEPEPDQTVGGSVTIPDSMTYNEISVVSGTDSTTISSDGGFQIIPTGIVYAVNKETNEMIYMTILPAGYDGTETKGSIQLNSLETAVSLVYLSLGITGWRPDLFVSSAESFTNFKNFISSKESTQALADGIESVVKEFGELSFTALSDILIINATEEITGCAEDILEPLIEEPSIILALEGAENQYSIFAPYLEYNTLSGLGDFKVEIDNAVWLADENMWELECTVYNGTPQYYSATSGYYDEATNKIIYDKTSIRNLLLPYNTSSFYKDFSSCEGFGKFITDVRNIASYGFEGLYCSTRNFTKNKIKVKVNKENDLLVLFNSQASIRLEILTMLQLSLNLTKNLAGLITQTLEAVNPGEDSEEKKTTVRDIFEGFVTELLQNGQMDAYILDGSLNLTKENFKEVSIFILNEFKDYITKDGSEKLTKLIGVNGLSEFVNVETILKEHNKATKLIEKVAKFTASTLDVYMVGYEWTRAYNGFYFKLNFDEYYELSPLPGTTSELAEGKPTISFSDEIDINVNHNCTIKGIGPIPQGSEDTFPLTPENVSYEFQSDKIVGIIFDKHEFNDGWDYEITIESGAIVDRNGVDFPGIPADNWTFTVGDPTPNTQPVINSLTANPGTVLQNGTSTLTCDATDADGDYLTYSWSATGGSITGTSSSEIWTAPSTVGSYTITCTVDDGTDSVSDTATITVHDGTTPAGFVFVQGGTFTMGDHFSEGYSSELPLHSVTVSDYYMGATEVTQAEWSAYMPAENWSSYGTGDNYPAYYVSWYEIIKYCNLRSMAEGLTPVYTISSSTDPAVWGTVPTSTNTTWNAAICNWSANGYRLPSEAEWEYASRGGIHNEDNLRYSGCNLETDLTNYAWYSANSGSSTHPVGTKLPNQLGLYDMSGNLWEWCWDWYGSYTSDSVTNPYGPTTGSDRVGRGGYWYSNAYGCRVAGRDGDYPYNSDVGIGFRLSRTP